VDLRPRDLSAPLGNSIKARNLCFRKFCPTLAFPGYDRMSYCLVYFALANCGGGGHMRRDYEIDICGNGADRVSLSRRCRSAISAQLLNGSSQPFALSEGLADPVG
jgi:hypothetical protein